MDPAEERFVYLFIRNERRERLLHELTAPKKRYRGISRFCHQAEDLLDPAKILMQGEDLERNPEFEKFVRENNEQCFIMSPDSFIDGQYLNTEEAVAKAVMCPDAAVIIGSTFAIVMAEPMKGGRNKYLMTDSDTPRAK